MKQKMKPIIKILILSFFITLFTRCSEDVYEENLSQSKRDYHFKKITFLELKSINNQAFIESSKLKKVLPPDKHNTLNSISNFDIDLQNIQYLKKTNNHETFSFRVLNVPDSRFTQNIIIDCKPNATPETYLVTYYLDKPLRQINNNDDFINSVTSTQTTRIESSGNGNTTNSCVEVGYYEEVDACEGELVTPGANPNCFNSDGSRRRVQVFRVIASDCSTGGVADFNPLISQWGNNYSGGNSSDPNSIGGGGAGGETNGLNIFIPNYYTGYDLNDPAVQNMIQINQFIYNLYSSNIEIRNVVESTEWLLAYTNYWLGVNGGLTPENQNALTYAFNNLPNVYYQHYDNEYTPTQISQFHFNAFQLLLKHGEWLSNQDTQTQQNILQNINSIENIEFAQELIDLAIQNNATFNFDNTIDPANSLNFDNVEELQNYLNNFNNSVAINLETEDNGNNTKTSRFKFDLGMFAYLNVSVRQKLQAPSQAYSVENISSSISGLTLAMEWEQNDDDDLNVSGNIATVTFTGTLSINCFVDGIGVFFSDNVTIICSFNTTTGTLISSQLIGLE